LKKRRLFLKPDSFLWKYVLAVVIGILVGYKVISVPMVVALYFILAAVCGVKAIQGNLSGFLSVFPFAIYLEVYVRGFAKWVPYLTLQYLMIFSFSAFILHSMKNVRTHFGGYSLLVLYTILEVVNNIYPDKPEVGKALTISSFCLLSVVIWASMNIIKPLEIKRLLSNIKIGTVFLTGVVMVSHLTGKINYGTISNSDASNGLAPVQLSGYLGAGCILFFLSIMNKEESKDRLLNILTFAFSTTIMVLTFSRGGLYFIAGVVAVFLFYNRAQFGNYLKFIFLVPVAWLMYNYIVQQTGGKIVERYGQEGASQREVLVSSGFELFLRNPITGVGTGNFNTRIVKEHLFSTESGAHNEFVRAAAEHGVLGISLYWGFFIFVFIQILRRRQPEQQYAMYFLVLFCLISVHNGLKISLQPILLMLAIGIVPPTASKKSNRNFALKELPQAEPA
jgi:hypothetical protein